MSCLYMNTHLVRQVIYTEHKGDSDFRYCGYKKLAVPWVAPLLSIRAVADAGVGSGLGCTAN
jgi:hypothetical protein